MSEPVSRPERIEVAAERPYPVLVGLAVPGRLEGSEPALLERAYAAVSGESAG